MKKELPLSMKRFFVLDSLGYMNYNDEKMKDLMASPGVIKRFKNKFGFVGDVKLTSSQIIMMMEECLTDEIAEMHGIDLDKEVKEAEEKGFFKKIEN